MQFKIRYLWSAFAAAAIAIFCLASPAGAWSAAEEGAVSIHATSGYGGSVPAVQVDSAGNIYACGHFRTGNKSYDVDPNPAVTVNVSVTGLDSSVISKYSPSGNLLWYLVLDADDDDQVLDCALNAAGTHLAVSGEFKGTMNFPGSAADIASAGGFDAYLALIATTTSTTDTTAPSGVLWGKTLGGTAVDAGTGVGFGSSNEVYVGGHFKGEVDINWGTGSADNRTSAGSEDVFLTKFAVDGSLQWSKTWGGSSNDVANALAIDGNDVYIGGYLGNTAADYDPGSGTVMIGGTSGGQGGYDSWISKFNPTGNLQWAKNFGASSHDRIVGMAATGGNVYATGYQTGTGGDWDTGSGTIVLGSGDYDPFTIKLNSSGVTQWVFAVGGIDTEGTPSGKAIAVDGSGNVYTAGHYRTTSGGTADLESGSGTTNFTSYSAGGSKTEVFLLKHNSAGVHQWAEVFPSYGNAYAYGLTTLGSDVYMSGYFVGWMDFDPSAGDATVRSSGSSEGFVAKYTSAGALATGNAPPVENPPSGFQVVHGPVDGDQLQGYEAEVVLTTPLCAAGQWQFNRVGDGVAVRQYVVQDSALTASGLGIGAYIKANYTDGGSTVPHHNLLWVGSQIDHDGNTSSWAGVFKNLGWTTSAFNFDVASNANPITFSLEADGSFKWIKTGQSTWSASTVDYDGAGGAGTGVVPSGWSVYLAFAAKNSVTRTLTSGHLSVSHSSCGSPGFTVSESSRTVSETGSAQTFTVVLTGTPSSNVVIDVASNDTGEATVSPAQLTFTASNWDTPQTITVTGINDDVDDGNQASTVTVSVVAASSDDDFDNLADQTVSVTTTDVDTAGLTISKEEVLVTEGGTEDTFTVALAAKPTSNVVIDVSSSDTGEATVRSEEHHV